MLDAAREASINSVMDEPSLTFTELERRIVEIPDGPSAVFDTPRAFVWLNAIGTLGAVVGLLPSLLIRFIEPRPWMVPMVYVGLVIEAIFYAPFVLRGIWVIASEAWRWRPKLVEQLDHDVGHFHALTRWLIGFPKSQLIGQLRFVEAAQQRMGAKIGLLVGGVDKLGILPLLVALAVQLGNLRDLANIPYWQALLAIFLAITWLIAWIAALMRLRMQLYASLLADAIEQKGG